MGHATVPDESQADVSVHGFWNWGTSALFDKQIFNLYAGSYVRQTSTYYLVTTKKGVKDKYLQTCLERRRSFTPMVYSADGIPKTEDITEQRRLAPLLSNKLKREYLEMCGFVRARMSLAIVRSNILLLYISRE